MIGRTLGHYRILDRLGAGGMGEVWLAEDSELGRKVAIKTLRGDVHASPTQLARFRREARAVAALNHANIVTLYSVEEADGLRFLVMEYVQGVRLEEKIPAGGMPPLEMLRIGAAIADALATAHEQGILHRDLKPGNVLVTPDGRVKVVDFGLARVFHSESGPFPAPTGDTSMTHDGLAIGTLHYMSPEQLEGQPLDQRSDLFSLGVLLFELATGERPFYGDSAVQVISSILRDEPSRIDTRTSRLPPAVADLIDRLLAKDPKDRPDSAAEVRDLLLEAARGFSSETTAASARGADTRSGRRAARAPSGLGRGAQVAIAAALATAIAALLAYRLAGSRTSAAHSLGGTGAAPGTSKPPSIAVLPLADFSGDPDYFVDGMTDGMIGALARIEGLRVISRQSTMHYKGSDKRLPEIARELGVDYVVEASLRHEKGTLRIETKLFKPDPEEQLWSDTFDRSDPEVLALHADVARAIAGAIHIALRPAGGGPFTVTQRVDPAVYEPYLRGRHLSEQVRPESLAAAKASFEEALRADPNFAPAHAGLAAVYGLLAYLFEQPAENSAHQESEARRAIELQPDLAEAYVVLGDHQRYFKWDWAASEASYRKAIELDPNSPGARRGLWALLAGLGRLEQAREQLEIAAHLEPLSAAIENDLGYQAMFEQNIPAARLAFGKAVELDPDFPSAHGGLWTIADPVRDEKRCTAELRAWAKGTGFGDLLTRTEQAAPNAPYRERLRNFGLALEEASSRERVAIGLGAAILAGAGETERAVAWLERGFQQRDPELVWLAMDPSWIPLRASSRYRALVDAMGLPQPRGAVPVPTPPAAGSSATSSSASRPS